MKIKTTLSLEEGVVSLAKMQSIKENLTLSQIVEEALNQYLPTSISVELVGDPKEMKIKFVSGPTVQQMQPNVKRETIVQKIRKQAEEKYRKENL